MANTNPHYAKIEKTYLFTKIEEKTSQFDPQLLINLGIGDVSCPLSRPIKDALIEASSKMATEKVGYGPTSGHNFLKKSILDHEYKDYAISEDEIFISDGITSDIGGFQELLSPSSTVLVIEPTYPLYLDSNLLAGKTRESITFLSANIANDFKPLPPSSHHDIIYICSPHNPTGVALDRATLKAWVDYAIQNKAIIFFDGAYEGFITSSEVPKSIFEIEGATKVAIECRSFSKSAGFTGLRCGYSVVPKNLHLPLNTLWRQRQDIRTNGVSYPIQKAAAAALSKEGQLSISKEMKRCSSNAKSFKQAIGANAYGGINSPYVWWKIPNQMTSFDFFEYLLQNHHLVTLPGSGFGPSGEGFVRLSALVDDKTAKRGLAALKEINL